VGREARLNRLHRHLGDRPLDERESQRVADSLRASVAYYGLKLNPSATVSRMIAVAERSAREGVLEAQDDEQVRLLGHAQHVAACLERFREVDDRDRVVAWVRKSLDLIDAPGSDGLDRLLEIEVAGRLAEEGLFKVATTEPDVLAVSEAGSLTCACKHPDTVPGAAKRIIEGGKQVELQGHTGLVVVSLDSLFHQRGKYLGVHQPEEASAWGKAKLDVTEKECDAAIQEVSRTSPNVAGIIFLLAVPYVSTGPPRTSGFRRVGRAFAKPGVTGSRDLVFTLARVLIGGLTGDVRQE